MNAEQKKIALECIRLWGSEDLSDCAGDQMAALLQELVDAPEPEPVARVTGYYAGYLSIATVDGRVLSAGTALYLAPPAPSVPDGWKLVPVEPTPEMMRSGMNVPINKAARHNAVYRSMLEAAPQPEPLSDERILEIWASNSGHPVTMGKARIIAQARAIEREILGGEHD